MAPAYDMLRATKASTVVSAGELEAVLEGGAAASAIAAGQAAVALEHEEGIEAQAQLNFVLTMAALGMLYFLRQLGAVLGQCEQLQQENARLKEESGGQSDMAAQEDVSSSRRPDVAADKKKAAAMVSLKEE